MTEINVEKVLKLEQEFESAKRETIKQLLERQKETAEQLKALGHDAKAPKAVRQKKPCSKCKSTEHDARFHRGETVKASVPEIARTAAKPEVKH